MQKYCTRKWKDMKVLLLSALLSIAAPKCSKQFSPTGLPDCIQQKINSIKGQPRWNPPAQVDEYLYNGKTVYLFSADCCDQYSVAYDMQCNAVCAPAGGLTGKGDRKCLDFFTTAKHVKLVWKDER